MRLNEMFVDQDAASFEQRRDEVMAIVSSATDLAGAESGLTAIVTRMGIAHDEGEFDVAFEDLVTAIKGSALVPVDAA
ncbi:MAG TPA: hypothetical protein VIX84_20130 [Acidimicrobiales bacterium]